MSKEKQTYNPCDDCQYSYSKNNQESGMCKMCEFRELLDYHKQSEGEWIVDTEYYDDEYSECNARKVFVCSKCGRTERRKEPYCNCGAKMNGGE